MFFITKLFGSLLGNKNLFKYLFVGILIVGISYFAGSLIYTIQSTYTNTFKENKQLNEDNVKLKDTITSLKLVIEAKDKEIKLLKESAAIDLKLVTENQKEHMASDKVENKVINNMKEKVNAIKSVKPVVKTTPLDKTTVIQDEPEEIKISRARIESIWEVYCEADVLSHGDAMCGAKA